ncbi:unnamed protein product [Microthlaspi erraticum]|uniref:FBD domain-containing protein n=1 Tax=Microthlaspi erraticum TaxID=1685480 RepID=A0A6D2J7H3_9BRAS|nr:unnamed protein product [Microthlaspi erraticum]
MPELEEAYVDFRYNDIESLFGSITSVKCLTICSRALYGDGFVFNQLEDLKLCDCTACSSMLLSRLLIDSPNLGALNIFQMKKHYDNDMVLWTQPSHVPACFESSLQTFVWSGYLGGAQDRDVAVYVLKWAKHLKTATISSNEEFVPKLEMLKDLVTKRKRESKTVSRPVCKVDQFSGLSDDLLLKILSYLPTKLAGSTSILSKQWEYVWKWLPKLKFHALDIPSQHQSLRCFLDHNLPLHKAPVIDSFHISLCSSYQPGDIKAEDIKLWLEIAISSYLRHLNITYSHWPGRPSVLPSSLYTCKSLVDLRLTGTIPLDVPRLGCLPSLKNLELDIDGYLYGVSLLGVGTGQVLVIFSVLATCLAL